VGADWCCGDGGKWRDHRELRVYGLDFGAPDDGGQRQGGFEHGEVVADTGARPGAEGKVLPAVPSIGVLRAEPVGVEDQRMIPQGWIPLIAAYPSGPLPDLDYGTMITPTRYNGMPAFRWNNLTPYCLTYRHRIPGAAA
jgi:hypothetical protein